MFNVALGYLKSTKSGLGAFLSLRAYKTNLISALVKILSGGAANVISSLLIPGYL